jgi:hypothetical protein
MRRIALAFAIATDESEKNRFARKVVARLHVVLAAELQKRSRPIAVYYGGIRLAAL